MTCVVDTHVLFWWTAEPERLSTAATEALTRSTVVGVAGVTWWELTQLAGRGRISLAMPVHAWLSQLAARVRTLEVTPAIACAAVALPADFPRDPADRIIYATALEHGAALVTKDEAIRRHRHPTARVIW